MFLEKIREENTWIPANNLMGCKEVSRWWARCKCGAEVFLVDSMDND